MNLNTLLAQMAVELSDLPTPEATVEAVTQYARVAVGADDAGVMLVHGRGRVETPTGTSENVDKAHQLQAELAEGPCLAAVAGGDQIYTVTNIRDDERWRRWGKAAAELGYKSTVSASLETGSRRIGSLNIYWRDRDSFDDSDVEVISLFASHASVAIAAANTRNQLEKALETRTTIGQAQGILMHAFGLDAVKAFAYLGRLSQDTNVKLVKVAQEIIENRERIGRAQAEPPP